MNPNGARVKREKLRLMGPKKAAMLAAAVLLLGNAWGQPPLKGVIDIHAHCDPDILARSIDAIDLARLAKTVGRLGQPSVAAMPSTTPGLPPDSSDRNNPPFATTNAL